jgi:hypothetical protein
MTSPNTTPDQRFLWGLTQERITLLAEILLKAETVFDVMEPGGRAAEHAACLLTELREQCCQSAGAADPFPYMALSPRFEEQSSPSTEVTA